MEQHLGRTLYPDESVRFKNGHTPPITLDMLELVSRRSNRSKIAARLAVIEDRIRELQAEREILEGEYNAGD
jgi:hypothetical protein